MQFHHFYQIFFFELLLNHRSIKQLPGPISRLDISDKSSLLTMVKFDMPPIFNIQAGKDISFCFKTK